MIEKMEGEEVDLTIDVDRVSRASQDRVDYYIDATDPNDEQVMVTVFKGNCPDIDFQENGTYRITTGVGERWEDGTPGIKIESKTSVEKLDPSSSIESVEVESIEVVGNEIEEDDVVDIALQIETINHGDPPLAYNAWCRDELGETVVVTVFEDQKPEIPLEEEQWYFFHQVDGERWEDGTPGIKLNNYSQVEHRGSEFNKETGKNQNQTQYQNQNTGTDPLVIDTVSNEPEEIESSILIEQPNLPIILSGLVTAIAIGASLFAPELGTATAVVIFIIGTGFAVGAAYYTNRNPAAKLRQRRQRKHIRVFLELLIRDYQKMVDNDSTVRANVMVPDRSPLSRLGFRPTTLSMLGYTNGYKDSEIELEYNVEEKEGNCGRAYLDGKVRVYDKDQYPEHGVDLPPSHSELTKDTNSILSVPIKITEGRSRRRVGVLNIDSTSDIEDTKFDNKDIQNLAYRYADMIGDVLR